LHDDDRTKEEIAKKERIIADLNRQEELEKEAKIEGQKRKDRKTKVKKSALSFGDDEEGEGEDEEDLVPKKKLKNPTVDTSFLPDRDRELQEIETRKQLTQEWHEQQEKLKKEVGASLLLPLSLAFSPSFPLPPPSPSSLLLFFLLSPPSSRRIPPPSFLSLPALCPFLCRRRLALSLTLLSMSCTISKSRSPLATGMVLVIDGRSSAPRGRRSDSSSRQLARAYRKNSGN
jgi:hypothetical protein